MSDPLAAATVAVLGFGNQGEAQALVIRESGLDVVVGTRSGGPGEARAREHGFATFPLEEAARRAQVVTVLLPDEVTPRLWPVLHASIGDHACVVFAHGFNLLYRSLRFPPAADVILVSPTGPGASLRRIKRLSSNMPAYLAVYRDGSGQAWPKAEAYAERLGCSPTWRTTVREETEVDLFGEQVVLCGGMNALVRMAWEVLVEEGYSPEMAYLECVHQLKHLADLLHERGVTGLRGAISATARYGDLTRGERVIGAAVRQGMREILAEIRSGQFAKEWQAEVENECRRLDQAAERAATHPSEQARLRALGQAGERS